MGLMWLARALGQQGDADGAAEVMRRAEDSHGMRSELYSPELRLARASTLAAARDVHGAMAAARDAARVAASAGQRSIALLAHHDAVRLGDTHAVDAVARLNSEIPCALSLIVLRHARALATRDGAALAQVAIDLADVGMNACAADAAAQAAMAFNTSGDRKGELKARAHAAELARQCGAPPGHRRWKACCDRCR